MIYCLTGATEGFKYLVAFQLIALRGGFIALVAFSYRSTAVLALSIFFMLATVSKAEASNGQSTLAGQYKCPAVHGTLKLIERADHRLEFILAAMWIGDVTMGNVNTGKAHGFIELDRRTARYKDPEGSYTLLFKFKHNAVDIKYDGTGFGQWKVTPAGHYKKVGDSKDGV